MSSRRVNRWKIAIGRFFIGLFALVFALFSLICTLVGNEIGIKPYHDAVWFLVGCWFFYRLYRSCCRNDRILRQMDEIIVRMRTDPDNALKYSADYDRIRARIIP